ncbi:MAG: glycosyl hydrolase family 17 [Bacteroidetes bacterium]|nr:glycosyl hydrolase family 17 [Bacteroidota bacterium]
MTFVSCSQSDKKMDMKKTSITAAYLLGNSDYPAISFGGYRDISRDIQPTVGELKEDVKILFALGFKVLRTYNVYYDETSNLLKAISEVKKEDPNFEMYLMMGIWIDCKNAFTDEPDRIRDVESEKNEGEVARAVALANQYPEIVKIMAVGNEAMVHWQWNYYVEPGIILKWVNHLQDLKKNGKLPKDIWVTSSDNFASWGGGEKEYHKDDLNKLINAVDYISMHTYPMHDTHYNPNFWGVRYNEVKLTNSQKIDSAMKRSLNYAISQYNSVKKYVDSIGVNKPVHIGESGWSSFSNELYGDEGSRAVDEYKSGIFYKQITEWASKAGVSVFYFEAFDEKWKDAINPGGSENHFGLIDLNAKAKYMIWDKVDAGVLKGLTRGGKPITKTYNGDLEALLKIVKVPPTNKEIKKIKK